MPISRRLKVVILSISGLLGLIVVAATVLLLSFDEGAYKPRLEAAASRTLGMEVKVEGAVGISLVPLLSMNMGDLRVRNRGTDLVSAEQARIRVSPMSLFRDELRVRKITLQNAVLSIEQDGEGSFNFELTRDAARHVPPIDLTNVSVSDATVVYVDKRSGKGFEARHCNIDVGRLQHRGGMQSELMRSLSVTASAECAEFQRDRFNATDLKFSATGVDGVLDVEPLTMRVFGAHGSGNVKADLSGEVPQYVVHFSLPQFRIEDFFATLSPKKVVDGQMDFSADLSAQGRTMHQLRQAAAGQFSLRGRDLTIIGRNLDHEFADFRSSQSFNLADVGAFFFAGPLGLVVTKGYDFAQLFKATGGTSQVDILVSDWNVERGVAQARDVAMATKKNRLAMHGGLDFVDGDFDDVVIALVDGKGCAVVRQRIRGTFQQPVIEQPSALEALAGPVTELLKQAGEAFTSGDCHVFYAGSVAPPK